MNYCEAMIRVGRAWTRCGVAPAERHHRLTRARGGQILDAYGESYHLMYLCRKHHARAEGELAYEHGLLLDGYVTTHPDGKPLYAGSDRYLKSKYGWEGGERAVGSSTSSDK